MTDLEVVQSSNKLEALCNRIFKRRIALIIIVDREFIELNSFWLRNHNGIDSAKKTRLVGVSEQMRIYGGGGRG